MYYTKIQDPQLRQDIVDEYADGKGLTTGEIASKHDLNEQSVVLLLEDLGKLAVRY